MHEDIVNQANEAGLLVRVGNVNTLEEAATVRNAGVEFIDSDNLGVLLAGINR